MAGVKSVWMLLSAAAVVAVAGCGGSHSTTTTTSSNAPASATASTSLAGQAPSSTGALPIKARVLTPADLHGFIVTPSPTIVHSSTAWATGAEGVPARQVAAESSRLRRLGFVAGIDEHLHGTFPLTAEALSIVEQYRSAPSARAELAYQYASAKSTPPPSGRFTTFPVSGIPGAIGWQITSPSVIGINVLFADGPFYYGVGSGYPPNTHNAPTRAEVIAVASALYRRVHGHGTT